MGGVATGDQVVGRARTLAGPYEWRHTLTQGATAVNGPHQGGWLQSADGRDWFVHFQQRGAHGRIVWLEPMRWQEDWPLMGTAATSTTPNEGGTGTPVLSALGPALPQTKAHPQTSDDFNSTMLTPMWEWNHNPVDARWSLQARSGFLRLAPLQADGLLHARNTLTACMQDKSFDATVRLDFEHMADGDHVDISAFERGLTGIGIRQAKGKREVFTTSQATGDASLSETQRTASSCNYA